MTMQLAPSVRKPRPEWQTEMVRLAVLYMREECGLVLPVVTDNTTEIGLIENDLAEMMALGLLEINRQNTEWIVTDKGRETLAKVVSMCDHLMKFEIFGGVRLTRSLTEEERLDDNEFQCRDHVYDARFVKPKEDDPNATDLRSAMILFLSEQMASELDGEAVDPRRIVFLQKLASGRFKGVDFWFNLRLGSFFTEVEEIVASQYKWRDIVEPEDETPRAIAAAEMQAIEVMQVLYTAGMLEQRKRDGSECSKCHIPLAVFELGAKQNGQTLTECPNPSCGVSYNPPQPQGSSEECPNCHEDIWPNQRTCSCGAIIDRRYRAGSVNQTTTATTETVYDPYYSTWGCCNYGNYGYVPYGYYDPWDPFVDAVAFGCLCAILW